MIGSKPGDLPILFYALGFGGAGMLAWFGVPGWILLACGAIAGAAILSPMMNTLDAQRQARARPAYLDDPEWWDAQGCPATASLLRVEILRPSTARPAGFSRHAPVAARERRNPPMSAAVMRAAAEGEEMERLVTLDGTVRYVRLQPPPIIPVEPDRLSVACPGCGRTAALARPGATAMFAPPTGHPVTGADAFRCPQAQTLYRLVSA
jgi:hypothetical protein